ncbi:hypothetical protein C1T27_07345 [Bacillus licheniformis]|jgi:HNH endonuclease/AP2 domain|nr:hypothetical protein C1T27_07345 [Bacillus licheniformis]
MGSVCQEIYERRFIRGVNMKNSYEVRGDTAAIFIKCKGRILETLISIEDLEVVKSFPNTWYGYWVKRRQTYIVAGNLPWKKGEKRKRELLHRWIMNPEKDMVVDHINFNTLDNRRGNLRILTNAQNSQNRKGPPKNNSSGYMGVHRRESGKYIAYLYSQHKRVYLGTFETAEKAYRAVLEKRRDLMPFSQL